MFKVKEEYKKYDHRRAEVADYIFKHDGLKKPKKSNYVEPETGDLDFDDNLWHASEELSERRADARRLQSMVTPDMAFYSEMKMDEGFGKYCRALARHIKTHEIRSPRELGEYLPPLAALHRRLKRSPALTFVIPSGERSGEAGSRSPDYTGFRLVDSISPTLSTGRSFFRSAPSEEPTEEDSVKLKSSLDTPALK